mgnify:FL=1
MYAIVRKDRGGFYTSVVFGFFCKPQAGGLFKKPRKNPSDYFYLVLNEDKTCLVKHYLFPQKSKRLDPRILIVEADQSDWVLDSEGQGCVSFLQSPDLSSDEIALDTTSLKRCIQMDAEHVYHAYVDVTSNDDLENLMFASRCFHDAYILAFHQEDDSIYVLFDGVWGCRIEIWFAGDAACNAEIRNPQQCDIYWYSASLLRKGDFIYLIDDENATPEDLDDGHYCWFKARQMRYHIIPNP